MPHDLWGPIDKQHWAPFRNDSGETVPAHAVLRITGTTRIHGRLVFTADQPDSSTQKWYGINGAADVKNGKIGECTFTPQCIAAFTGSTPAAGDDLGPSNGSWYLSGSGTGFVCLGSRENNRNLDLAEVVQVSATGTSSVTESDWAQLTVSTGQSISGASPIGTSYTQISFSGASDSGGILDALSATDEIDCSEAAPTLAIDLDATFAHTDVGAGASFGIVGAVRFAVRRNGSTQNPTFEDMSVLGSASEFPAVKYNASIIVDFSTASAGDDYELWVSSTVDIDINGITFTIREVKDAA